MSVEDKLKIIIVNMYVITFAVGLIIGILLTR